MEKVYLTQEGYDKLLKKLNYMKKEKRSALTKAIGLAREHGDLKENAEYSSAKEEMALNEKAIRELEHKLGGTQILDEGKIPKDEILIGATVKLKDLASDAEITYTLVSTEESDFSQGKISTASLVGKGLLNHKENDIVEIQVPAGLLKYKVLKISRG
ncbi:MAG: transcription elongation factor GreA [Elusimicrobiota bacterium]